MLRTKTWLAGLMAVAVLSGAPLAAAQTGDKAAAEALFQAGRDLMTAGKFAEACSKLEASQRLDAGLGTLLYLADCYEKAGKFASSWATFREAESIAMSRSDQGRASVAQQRAVALEPKLSKVWFKVGQGVGAATELKLNGRAVTRESWDVAIPVDAGDQAIEASAPGRKPWKTIVRIEGQATSVPVDIPLLEAAPVEAAPPPPPATPGGGTPPPADTGADSSVGSTQRILGLVVGGVGVVGLGVGGVFGLGAKSKKDQSLEDGNCPDDPNVCNADGVALRKDALKAANAATIFMIGGGALLAGGVVLYLTAPSGSSSTGSVKNLRLATEGGFGTARVTLKGAF